MNGIWNAADKSSACILFGNSGKSFATLLKQFDETQARVSRYVVSALNHVTKVVTAMKIRPTPLIRTGLPLIGFFVRLTREQNSDWLLTSFISPIRYPCWSSLTFNCTYVVKTLELFHTHHYEIRKRTKCLIPAFT